ncbi:MAG: PHP domain-containing protein [Chitinophagales bacterium]|nr:helix-hairpin-helix domain-containing protein [Chitinophagales bacterium]MCZ2393845.1 PHP domain-containing protein [Chitinophagales bacterium]
MVTNVTIERKVRHDKHPNSYPNNKNPQLVTEFKEILLTLNPMDNTEIATHFKLLADLMELHGENPFKIKSYSNAARVLKKIDFPLEKQTAAALLEIPGIGKAISEKIIELTESHQLSLLNQYTEKTPPGVIEMLQIPGIGPSKIAQLWKELNVETLGELYYACLENRLTLLKGFGEKTQEKIKENIEFLLQNSNQYLYARVDRQWKEQIYPQLQNLLGNDVQIIPTGDYRSQEISLTQLHLLVTNTSLSQIANKLQDINCQIFIQNEQVLLKSERWIDIIIEPIHHQEIACRLFETTGSQEHIQMVSHQLKTPIANLSSENEIYQNAGLPYFPPECRHSFPQYFPHPEEQFKDLITAKDILGVVHNHTIYSDGRNTIEELAKYCQQSGYQYLVVSDHSQSAFYANGLSVPRIILQHQEIDEVQKKLKDFKIFKSIECDILYDGQLDYDEDILKTFDLVIASVHSQLNMNEEKAMQRLIRAIENPYTHILGHLTGRLLLSRKGYPIDHKKIIDACHANHVIIEINANPHRLDIDWHWIPYCMEKGVWISINPDAHHLNGIHDIQYGIIAARKGGLQKYNCINTLDAHSFISTIQKMKNMSSVP